MRCCLAEEILQNRGILKHSDANFATSIAEDTLPVSPCGLTKEESNSPISLAYLDINPTKTAIFGSRFYLGMSKQLKYRLILFFKMKLPMLLAIVNATLLADVTNNANSASSNVIKVSY